VHGLQRSGSPQETDRALPGRLGTSHDRRSGTGPCGAQDAASFLGSVGPQYQWLISCGAAPSAPRRNVYLTSLIKCFCPDSGPYSEMANRCSHFLDAQISLQRPVLVITLGARADLALRFSSDPYSEAIGRAYLSSEHHPVSKFDHHFSLLPWPHPSRLNRLLSDATTRRRHQTSFRVVRPYVTDAA
jgi:uracil-DNA glycosylase family 4